jgi:hypothetical protein
VPAGRDRDPSTIAISVESIAVRRDRTSSIFFARAPLTMLAPNTALHSPDVRHNLEK